MNIIGSERDEQGVVYLTNRPRCGQDVYLNGHNVPVTALTTYWALEGLPHPKARPMRVGDSWLEVSQGD